MHELRRHHRLLLSQPPPSASPSAGRPIRRVMVIVAVAQAVGLAALVGWLFYRHPPVSPPTPFDALLSAYGPSGDLDAARPHFTDDAFDRVQARCGGSAADLRAALAARLGTARAEACRGLALHVEGRVGHVEVICGGTHYAPVVRVGPQGGVRFAAWGCGGFLSRSVSAPPRP